MVSNATLAAVCVWSGLHEHLMFESYTLANNIRIYADELSTKEGEEYALAQKECRSPGQYWLEIEPPKVRMINLIVVDKTELRLKQFLGSI